MDETWILQRFLARDEEGLAAAYAQLGPGLTALAARIAGPETAEECVNDALLAAWQAIPPLAPVHLAAYLAKLTRNAALNRYRAQNAQKRGGSIVAVSLDELAECLPGGESPADRAEAEVLRSALSAFLRTLPERQQQVFLARYFYALPLSDIAARFSMRENTVKTTLHRTRRRLRDYLEQEGLSARALTNTVQPGTGGTLMRPEDLYDAFHEIDDDLLKPLPEAAPRRHPALRWGALAACALLAAGGLLWLRPWKKTAPQSSLAVPTLASEPTANESTAASGPAMPEPAELVYSTELFAAAADISYPEGYFIRTLSEAQLASIWGQETLWLTDAENEVIYDGSGVPWIVRLTVQTADGTLTAELSPEQLPPACLAEPAEETCEVFGVPVAAAAGPSHAVVSFVRGEGADAVGMRITMEGELPPLQELAARLVTQSLEPDGVLQLHQLETADIPVWRSEQLDEEAAYADERFGCYLPTAVALPFDRAHRELGEGRDWLTASWSADVQNLTVTVSHPSEIPTLVHADETARYDLHLPEDGAAVDPDARNFPVFYREELTRDVLAARLWQGDFAGCSGASFGVLEPDGTLLEISVYAQDPLALLGFLLDG